MSPARICELLLLEARRNKVFLPEKEVLSWAEQLANALTFLHVQEPPIVHRDIKPSNLKLMPHGLIKLVDFGLVKILAPEEITITIIQGQGTALYTPLEQYGGSDVTYGHPLRYLFIRCDALSSAHQRISGRCTQALPSTRKPGPRYDRSTPHFAAHRESRAVGNVAAPG
jgi:serine/threonine protein kinase